MSQMRSDFVALSLTNLVSGFQFFAVNGLKVDFVGGIWTFRQWISHNCTGFRYLGSSHTCWISWISQISCMPILGGPSSQTCSCLAIEILLFVLVSVKAKFHYAILLANQLASWFEPARELVR